MFNSWTRHALCDLVLSYKRDRWKFEHIIRHSMRNKMWLIYNNRYFHIRTFYKKNQLNLLISCVSVVVSGDFCYFKLAFPSLLFMSKDEVKAAHSEIDCCPHGGWRWPAPQKSFWSAFFSAAFYCRDCFFFFWSCMTDNLVLKLWASVPVTYLVKIRIRDVFFREQRFLSCVFLVIWGFTLWGLNL